MTEPNHHTQQHSILLNPHQLVEPWAIQLDASETLGVPANYDWTDRSVFEGGSGIKPTTDR
ncbi:MAG: hypothetical protein HC835_12495 [Oscillatoriales cyanobacterium RM2_1_1]|nr:hypothetical protein [Oscillatoriales cyanobacterium SM2_3_0]NJO46373.1 hypothetical protein [Oscillatoriales cyanobacterium RM2_1_1]